MQNAQAVVDLAVRWNQLLVSHVERITYFHLASLDHTVGLAVSNLREMADLKDASSVQAMARHQVETLKAMVTHARQQGQIAKDMAQEMQGEYRSFAKDAAAQVKLAA